jgi:hypothetical protein
LANTVNINKTQWDGYRGSINYNLTSDATALSDLLILDISTLAPAPSAVKIRSVQWTIHGNFILTAEIDATTDQAFLRLENQTADTTIEGRRDFTDTANGGWSPDATAAGFTGDILLTSSGLAASDDFDLFIVFEKSG